MTRNCALVFEIEELGKLDDGYGYREVDMWCPVMLEVKTSLFDAKGRRRAARDAGTFGLFFPYPYVSLASIETDFASNEDRGDSSRDFGITVLFVGSINTSLLSITTAGLDLLFFPLWRKDRSPPKQIDAKRDAGDPKA